MAIDLGKQYGPLPLGAWLAVVAGGLGIAWYTRRSGATPIPMEDTSGVPGVGVGAPAPWTPITGTPPVTEPTPQEPQTNDQWAVIAIRWLVAQGYPPNVADSAVRKYISGVALSVQEYTLIGLALVAPSVGPPPQPLPPVEDQEPPPPPPPTNAATNPSWQTDTHHTVQPGESVTEFVYYYYAPYKGAALAWNEWVRINGPLADTPTLSNITFTLAGVPKFKNAQTYRLPGFVIKFGG